MQELIVQTQEKGQRLDKYLKRHLPLAPSSFLFKMLRKKNITLRGKKADGSEKVEAGDIVTLFLSDETIRKFSVSPDNARIKKQEEEADRAFCELSPFVREKAVLYEDEDILLVTKPAGILSQKAKPSDLSMNEWLRGYLRQKEAASGSPAGQTGFTPSVCNRLDRNTGGILLCAKSLQGSRMLSELIRDRKIRKTYRMVVHGRVDVPGRVEGELIKDREQNQVRMSAEAAGVPVKNDGNGPAKPASAGVPVKNDGNEFTKPAPAGVPVKNDGIVPAKPAPTGVPVKNDGIVPTSDEETAKYALTMYRPVFTGDNVTLIEADLITGRSHQLRVHMAAIGHPIVGDPRYGNRELDRKLQQITQFSETRKPRHGTRLPDPNGPRQGPRLPDPNGSRQGSRLPDPNGLQQGARSSDSKSLQQGASVSETKRAGAPGRSAKNLFGRQLLWCTSVTFPDLPQCGGAAGRTFISREPSWWKKFQNKA